MFALFKKQNPYEQAARLIYASCLERARDERFYADYGVPDILDARFDLLLLHEFLIVNRLGGEGKAGAELSQALFDVTFADMDQMLREMGIGDMGLPKRMRRMMKGFNGRMHVYSDALVAGDVALKDALARNVYAKVPEVSGGALEKMAAYVREGVERLASQDLSDLLDGRAEFQEIK